MFRERQHLPITLCLALFAVTSTAKQATGQQRGMRTSGSAELTTTVTLDGNRMAALAERSDGEKLTIFDAIRGAGAVSLSGRSSELMLVMFHVDGGRVTGVSESESFSMRGNATMSLDKVMYGEERPPTMGSVDPLGGWHIAGAGERPVSASETMELPDALLKSGAALNMPRGWQEMTGIVVMAVPADRGSLASAMARPAGLFLKGDRVADP